eukprot:TRINITY_DN10272_c0_g1_i4.p1 TRINITY_DN10272_c0_g1~~TRINITY_DN10272_c0_g1_i4.p1  ORF type:complete len:149 (+),score=10.20 TRINITY_DN10272_c0_g1_i4:171-617(+)
MEDEIEVFQCKSCRMIIGTSLDQAICEALLLRDVQNVIVEECLSIWYVLRPSSHHLLHISPQGEMAGCAYKNFTCGKCHTVLGVVYHATSPAYDFLRGYYTLNPFRITRYRYGSTFISVASPQQLLVVDTMTSFSQHRSAMEYVCNKF